jgi:hypothetical protein
MKGSITIFDLALSDGCATGALMAHIEKLIVRVFRKEVNDRSAPFACQHLVHVIERNKNRPTVEHIAKAFG